jgi:hypothetical protein
MSDEVPYPDFHAAIATLSPVLAVAALALHRYLRGGTHESQAPGVRSLARNFYYASLCAGTLAFSQALFTLAGVSLSALWVRVLLIIAVYVQFMAGLLAVGWETLRRETDRPQDSNEATETDVDAVPPTRRPQLLGSQPPRVCRSRQSRRRPNRGR